MKAMISLFVLALSAAAQATVYGPGAGGAIPDAVINLLIPGSLSTTINLTGTGTVSSVNSLTLTFGPPNHTWCGDVVAKLTAPNGDDVQLFCRLGVTTAQPATTGDSSDLGGAYVFTQTGNSFLAAAQAEGDETVVAPGTYARATSDGPGIPGGNDADDYSVFNGDNINGVWTLRIEDWGILDTGSLASWSLDMTVNNACPANIVSTGASASRVDVDDLLAVITAWGDCTAPPAACPANVVNTGTSAGRVDVDDLLAVITAWGDCP